MPPASMLHHAVRQEARHAQALPSQPQPMSHRALPPPFRFWTHHPIVHQHNANKHVGNAAQDSDPAPVRVHHIPAVARLAAQRGPDTPNHHLRQHHACGSTQPVAGHVRGAQAPAMRCSLLPVPYTASSAPPTNGQACGSTQLLDVHGQVGGGGAIYGTSGPYRYWQCQPICGGQKASGWGRSSSQKPGWRSQSQQWRR